MKSMLSSRGFLAAGLLTLWALRSLAHVDLRGTKDQAFPMLISLFVAQQLINPERNVTSDVTGLNIAFLSVHRQKVSFYNPSVIYLQHLPNWLMGCITKPLMHLSG